MHTARVTVFFFQAEDGIRGHCVTGVQTCSSDLDIEVLTVFSRAAVWSVTALHSIAAFIASTAVIFEAAGLSSACVAVGSATAVITEAAVSSYTA